MNRIVVGNKNKPLNRIIPIQHKINTVKIIELVFPDLNVKRGNFIKWIGLIIKNETSANKIIAVLGSP